MTTKTATPPTDLVNVLERLGVEVTGLSESRVFGLCPLHEQRVGRPDSKPSWSIDRGLRVHHCWSCGYKGTLSTLIVDILGGTPAWAATWLRDHARQTAISRARGLSRAKETPLGPVGRHRALEDALKGFEDPPDSALAKRRLERFAVQHYGILWDPSEPAWILPIRRENGELLGYQEKPLRGTPMNHPRKLRKRETLFGIEHIGGEDFSTDLMILVESPLDVVRLYSEGIPGGVSPYGAYTSTEQVAFLRLSYYRILLALDNDEAGWEVTDQLVAQLKGQRVRILDYVGTRAKDIGEMTAEEIHSAVAGARWAREYRGGGKFVRSSGSREAGG
jgi:Toprim domain